MDTIGMAIISWMREYFSHFVFFCWIWLSWQCITVSETYSVFKQIFDSVCSIVSQQGQATCKSELNLSAWSLQYLLAWVDDKQGAKKRRASRSCQVLFHACLLSCFIQDKLICISTSKLMKCATNLLQFLCENFHFLYFFEFLNGIYVLQSW